MPTNEIISEIYRTDSRRVLATLIRVLGDFDLAEEALADAFAAAAESWPREGVPENPRAWLVSTGRFKAIDTIRRQSRFGETFTHIHSRQDDIAESNQRRADQDIEDDRLRLIFTCCHPAIDPQIQVALTLREVCGLTTEEIAAGFLVTPATMAQRIVRGKAKIRDAGIPYRVPGSAELPERLETVLAVCYLIFNEGYSASSGPSLTRGDLSGEAIRLVRLLAELVPDPEGYGLLALMLFHESRRTARTTPAGELILLEEQDRRLWRRDLIVEARGWLGRALESREAGAYTIQAGIASAHAEAISAAETPWGSIVAWYDLLMQAAPSAVVELNRAVAIAMRDGAEAGLQLIEPLLNRKELVEYHLLYAAQGDLHRRLGHRAESEAAYLKALALAKQVPEREFLQRRLWEVTVPPGL